MRLFSFLFFFTFIIISAPAQKKIKYKHIPGLIESGEIEKAETFLKTLLVDDVDNPSANLFLAKIFKTKSLNEFETNTNEFKRLSDLAIKHYENAKKNITDKDLRKNEQYYDSYRRRNLRTGSFDVKISDIQLAIADDIALLEAKKSEIK